MPISDTRRLHLPSLTLLVLGGTLSALPCIGQQLANSGLSLRVGAQQDTYSVGFRMARPSCRRAPVPKSITAGCARAITRAMR